MARNDLRKPEIIQQMKEMRQNGATLKDIAIYFNCSPSLIKKLINEPVVKQRDRIDIIGQTINGVTALRRATKEETLWKSHATPIWGRCETCGREWAIRKEDFIKKTVCCVKCKHPNGGGRGNYNTKYIGQRFGHLVVLSYDNNHFGDGNHKKAYYWCQCDCGNIVSVSLRHLLGKYSHSRTISCGCSQESSGELKIRQILNENNINFQTQYIIPELSNYMKFDFAILNTDNNLMALIEYDGEQHFNSVEKWGGEEKLKIQQERDARKNKYCQEHGIPLLRIPYTDFNKITIDYILDKIPQIQI